MSRWTVVGDPALAGPLTGANANRMTPLRIPMVAAASEDSPPAMSSAKETPAQRAGVLLSVAT
jgi:hypothetical protein